MTPEELEKEIAALKERNRKVEADKAWETSWARKIIVAVLTYIGIALFFVSAGLPHPLLSAFVPTAAFVLSTLSLPWLKKWWTSNQKEK